MAQRRLTRQQRERIKQSQEQRRRRAGERAARQAATLSQNPGAEQAGLVIANFGPAVIVEDAAGSACRCAVRQNLGTLVCGDQVVWQSADADSGVVVAVEPRRTLLTRPDASGRTKPVAANLDQVIIVVAPRPELNEALIDRYLAAIALIDCQALLLVNKIDLLAAAALTELEARLAVYRQIGYPSLAASVRTGQGLAALRERLTGRASILVGQSGVGKSSLIKALLPQREIRVQALSEATGLGLHTTTTSMLYHLPDGGELIDSPGVRGFALGALTPAELDRGFIEFAPYLGCCQFSNCSHTVEPGCALLAAVAQGAIDARRLASYRQIKDSLKPSWL